MLAVPEFVSEVRERFPGTRVFRLEFPTVEAMSDSLLWMSWAKRPGHGETVVRKGVMARGFEDQARGILIVGGELTDAEVEQLSRVAQRYGAKAVRLRRRRRPTENPAGSEPPALTGKQLAGLGLGMMLFLALGLSLIWLLGGRTVAICDLRAAPERFEGRTVRIRGTAVGTASLPGVSAYRLQDATGRVVVVTSDSLPLAGREVVARGRVISDFRAGPVSTLVIVEGKPTDPDEP